MANLKDKLERESAVLVDPEWDAKEQGEWSEKVSEEAEKEALCLNLENLTISSPSIPDLLPNLAVSQIENLSLDLTNLLIDEGKSLQALRKELPETEVEPFNVEEYITFSPDREQDAQPQAAVNPDVNDFLDDI